MLQEMKFHHSMKNKLGSVVNMESTIVFLLVVMTKATPHQECHIDTFNYDIGYYNVLSFVSFNDAHIPENIVRFHLRLRYFVGRQKKLHVCRTIGFIAYNVCGKRDRLIQLTLNLFLNRNYARTIAVISYVPSEFTQFIAQMSTINEMPFLPYTDKDYEDYWVTSPNAFLREDITNVEKIIEQKKVIHVLLLSLKGVFGRKIAQFHRDLFWDELKARLRLSVTKYDVNTWQPSQIQEFVTWLKAMNDIKLILVWSDYFSRKRFMPFVSSITDRMWYWYSEFDFTLFVRHDIPPAAMETHVFRKIPAIGYQSLNRRFTYASISLELWRSTIKEILTDPWLVQYYRLNTNASSESMKNVPQSFLHQFDETDSLDTEIAEATILPLWWSQPFQHLCIYSVSSMRKRIHSMDKPDYLAVQNNVRLHNGVAPLEIYRVIRVDSKWERKGCPPGQESYMTEYNVSMTHIVYTWRCIPCGEGHVKEGDGNESCHQCLTHFIPNEEKTECYDPYTETYLNFKRPSIIAFVAGDFVAGVYAFIVLICYIRYRHTPVVRSSDYEFSLTQIISHVLISITLAPFFLWKPILPFCFAQLLVPGSIFILHNTINLIKSHKLLSIFQTKRIVSRKHVQRVRNVEYSMIFFTEVIFFGICFITVSFKKIAVNKQMIEATLERQVYCSNHLHFQAIIAYIMLITLISFIQCFRARKLPKRFNESKQILISSFIKFIMLSVSFPIAYGQKTQLDRKTVELFVLMVLNIFDLLIFFTHKMYMICSSSKNDASSIRANLFKKATKDAKKLTMTASTSQSR